MVKQRLAAIETASQANSPTSPYQKSPRGRQIIRPLPLSPADAPRRSVLLRHGTVSTVADDPAVASYGDGIHNSVLSLGTGRLTSIPSGQSIGNESNPWHPGSRQGTPRPLPSPSVYSPASRYSDISPSAEKAAPALSRLMNVEKDIPRPITPRQDPQPTRSNDKQKSVSRPTLTVDTNATATQPGPNLSIFSPYSLYAVETDAKGQLKPPTRMSHSLSQTLPVPPRSTFLNNAAKAPAMPDTPGGPSNHHDAQYNAAARNSLSIFSRKTESSSGDSVTSTESSIPSPGRILDMLKNLPTWQTVQPVPVHDIPISSPRSEIVTNLEHQARLSGLEDQIAAVKTDIRNLPVELGAVMAGRSTPVPGPPPEDENSKGVLHTIDNTVKRIEEQGERNAMGLAGIHAKVDALIHIKNPQVAADLGVSGLPASVSGHPIFSAPLETSVIMNKLEEMRKELKSDLPMLAKKLQSIMGDKATGSTEAAEMVASDAAPSSSAQTSTMSSKDTKLIYAKLDEMLSAVQASAKEGDKENAPDPKVSSPFDMT